MCALTPSCFATTLQGISSTSGFDLRSLPASPTSAASVLRHVHHSVMSFARAQASEAQAHQVSESPGSLPKSKRVVNPGDCPAEEHSLHDWREGEGVGATEEHQRILVPVCSSVPISIDRQHYARGSVSPGGEESLHKCSLPASDPRVSLPAMTELIISQAATNKTADRATAGRRSNPEIGGARGTHGAALRFGLSSYEYNHQRASSVTYSESRSSQPGPAKLRRAAQLQRKSLAMEIADEFQVFSKTAVPEAYRAKAWKALRQAEKENQWR